MARIGRVSLGIVVTAILSLAAACGSDSGAGDSASGSGATPTASASPSTSASASDSATTSVTASATPSETTSAPASPSASPVSAPPLPAGCNPPANQAVTFTQGSATVTVKDGPDAGTYTLPITAGGDNYLDTTGKGVYVFAGAWGGGSQPGVDYSIDDPVCSDPGFFGLTLGGGQVRYADGGHIECTNKVDSLSAAGFSGSFDCKDLDIFYGDGYPDTVNVSGTFFLTP
jgi:hypothetical protein